MIEKAIEYLKENGIESFERMGVLIIPTDSPEDLDVKASKIKKLLLACGYEKSWSIDPYYFEKRQTITSAMYDDNRENNMVSNDGNSAV